ncbi:MAG: hypothetical protein QM820_32160 [Minicystis sp.]
METTSSTALDKVYLSMLRRSRFASRALAAALIVAGVIVAGAGTAFAIDALSDGVGSVEGY